MEQSTQQLQGYGFVSDTDEKLKSKVGGKFGGNFGNAFITKFAFSLNVAKEGQPARQAIEIDIKLGDSTYKAWISPITQIYGKNKELLTDTTTEEYITKFNAEMVQQNASVIHYCKAVGITEDSIKAVLMASPITSFQDYAVRICSLFPAGFQNKPMDLFLEYQWNFGKKADGTLQDKTYPTLPSNLKGGYYIVPAQAGIFEEVREGGKLKYVNASGTEHPFERSENFMASVKGYQQVEGADNSSATANPAFTPGNGEAKTSTWAQ